MENSIMDKIMRGTITDVKTGESSDIEPLYLYFNPAEISAIVKVQWMESYYDRTKEVQGGCLALDWQGNVYKLGLYFAPESPDDAQKIRAYAARTGLAGHTKNSLTQLSALEKELAKVRRDAWANDNEELELGVRCMAAAVYDDQGKLVAGLSISAPASRLDEAWLPKLRATAEEISRNLGYRLP